MEAKEYLEQISASNRPVKANTKSGIFHSKFFIVGMIGVVGLILIMILGALMGGGKSSEKEKDMALLLHLNGTAEVVQEYQKSLKSSSLRSSSVSLYGVLTNTSRALESYLVDTYKYKEKDIPKKISTAAEEDKTALTNELFEAKINGLLDRTMARKMAYEISLFMNEESSILKTAKDESLKQLLNESYGSLETLYNNFNGFEGQ